MSPTPKHLRLPALVLLAAATLAACGTVGQPSGTATGAGSPSPNAGPALEFSRCMRTHGVTNFPDPPPGSGGIQIPDNVNPQSPAFRSAQQACKQFLPNNGAGSGDLGERPGGGAGPGPVHADARRAPVPRSGLQPAAGGAGRPRDARDGVRDSVLGRP